VPKLNKLNSVLYHQDYLDVLQEYRSYPTRIYSIAQTYRNVENTNVTMLRADGLRPEWTDDVNILLGPPGAVNNVVKDSRGLFVIAVNKIKHRFATVERLDTFAGLVPAGQEIPYARISLGPSHAEILLYNTITVALMFATIAVLLLTLEANGVSV
jgi:hypothetical protein